MSCTEFIVEMVRYLAWPIVTLTAVFLLRDKLSGILSGGIKSAKHGTTEVHFFDGPQRSKPEDTKVQDLQHLIPIDPTGLREELVEKINGELEQIASEAEKVDVLVKNLAQQQISNHFEKIYFSIFGSQIKLLEYLAVMDNRQETAKNLSGIFQHAKTNNPGQFGDWQFSDYMNFLLNWNLVEVNDDSYIITKYGRAFLTYITAAMLNKDKAL